MTVRCRTGTLAVDGCQAPLGCPPHPFHRTRLIVDETAGSQGGWNLRSQATLARGRGGPSVECRQPELKCLNDMMVHGVIVPVGGRMGILGMLENLCLFPCDSVAPPL